MIGGHVPHPKNLLSLKTSQPLCLVTILVGLAMSSARAQTTTTWDGPETISNSSEVNTEGTLVLAKQATIDQAPTYLGWNDQTVNDVTFKGFANTQDGVTFSLTGETAYYADLFARSTGKTLEGDDADAYAMMLDGAWTAGLGPLTIDLAGLTDGEQYLIQIWVADFRQFPNARTVTITTADGTDVQAPTLHYLKGDGVNNGTGSGQFVIGRFTAKGTKVTFRVTGNEAAQYNAFQLRTISPASKR